MSRSFRLIAKSFHRLLKFTLPLFVLPIIAAFAAAEEESREAILAAWQVNFVKLGSVELVLTQVLRDHTVTEETSEIHELPGGGSVEWTRSPRTEQKLSLTLFLDQLIHTNSETTRQRLFDGSRWHDYEPAKNSLTIRRIDQMPGMLPLDPREMFMPELEKPFLIAADSGKFRMQGDSDGDDQPQLVIDNGFNRLLIRFDRQTKLPAESLLFHSDGSVLRHTQMRYERVESRDAYVVSSVTWRCFDKGTANLKNLNAASPSHSSKLTVNKVTLLPPPVKGTLELALPANLRIVDLTPKK